MTEKNALSTAMSETMPAYLQEMTAEDVTGLDDIAQYVRPNRIRIVQALSPLREEEGIEEGDVVAMPAKIVLAKKGVPIEMIPIFFYPDWKIWNPRGFDGPMIREETRDPNHPMVAQCRDPEFRACQPCPEMPGKNLSYQEHLNFIVVIPSIHPTMLFSVSFAKTQHKIGSQWCNLLQMRQRAPFAGVYTYMTKPESNDEGKWFGPSIDVAGWQPDPELYAVHKELARQLGELRDELVNHDDSDDVIDAGVVEGDDEQF